MMPHVLPGGRAVLFTATYASAQPPLVVVQSLDGDRRELLEGVAPQYARTGHIVFSRDGSLWAAAFDLRRLELVGAPAPVVEGVSEGSFAIAENGTLAYAPERDSRAQALVWVDREGNEEALPFEPRSFSGPRLSPDGTELAVTVRGDNSDIWVYDLVRNAQRRLTFDSGADQYPLWTRDGTRIVFSSGREGVRNLYWRAADGTGAVERLTRSENIQSPWGWSGDGRTLIVQEQDPRSGWGSYAGHRLRR